MKNGVGAVVFARLSAMTSATAASILRFDLPLLSRHPDSDWRGTADCT